MLPAWRKRARRLATGQVGPGATCPAWSPPIVGLVPGIASAAGDGAGLLARSDAGEERVEDRGHDLLRFCREQVAQARSGYRELIPPGTSTNHIWWPSFVTLGAADVASLSHSSSRLLASLPFFGVTGGVGLILASSHDLKRAKAIEQRLDAGSDLAWGTQGLLYLSPTSTWVGRAATGLGVVGAAAQTTVGAMRIKKGVQRHDTALVKLGALDVSGGLLWLAWDLIGWEQPIFIGSYVLLMVGRELYANRDAVRVLKKNIGGNARRAYAEARDRLGQAQRDVAVVLMAIDQRARQMRAQGA